jgi:osmotically inducible lipoprotein OsmB
MLQEVSRVLLARQPVVLVFRFMGNMRNLIYAIMLAACLALLPYAVSASEKHMTGAAIGAGIGAILAGPPGAILGGAVGAYVKGPRITKHRYCWTGKNGRDYCEWR